MRCGFVGIWKLKGRTKNEGLHVIYAGRVSESRAKPSVFIVTSGADPVKSSVDMVSHIVVRGMVSKIETNEEPEVQNSLAADANEDRGY